MDLPTNTICRILCGMNLDFLISKFGSQANVARELNIPPTTVNAWRGDMLPNSAIGHIWNIRPDLLREWEERCRIAAATKSTENTKAAA